MEAVMILRKADPTWAEAKRQLNDPNFLMQLIQYQIETLNDSMLKKIDSYPFLIKCCLVWLFDLFLIIARIQTSNQRRSVKYLQQACHFACG